MSKTYKCDRCGHEERFTNGIVDCEFDYEMTLKDAGGNVRRQFKTLPPIPGVHPPSAIDVCTTCYELFQAARIEGETIGKNAITERFAGLMTFRRRAVQTTP